MKTLGLFLERYRNLVPPDRELKELLKQVVKEQTGHELKETEIAINKWTVYLKTKPAFKSELFIKQEAIQAELERLLQKRAPRKII